MCVSKQRRMKNQNNTSISMQCIKRLWNTLQWNPLKWLAGTKQKGCIVVARKRHIYSPKFAFLHDIILRFIRPEMKTPGTKSYPNECYSCLISFLLNCHQMFMFHGLMIATEIKPNGTKQKYRREKSVIRSCERVPDVRTGTLITEIV